MISAAEVVPPIGDTDLPMPANEGQAREAAPCPAEERPRCAAVKTCGEACRAWPAADGWPYCSAHRYLWIHARAGGA